MSSLREEILQEMQNPRVDKKRLFDILLKIADAKDDSDSQTTKIFGRTDPTYM